MARVAGGADEGATVRLDAPGRDASGLRRDPSFSGIRVPTVVLWFPALAVAAHIFEEFVWPGGFAEWYRRYPPGSTVTVTTRFLVLMNAILVVLALVRWLFTHRCRYRRWPPGQRTDRRRTRAALCISGRTCLRQCRPDRQHRFGSDLDRAGRTADTRPDARRSRPRARGRGDQVHVWRVRLPPWLSRSSPCRVC